MGDFFNLWCDAMGLKPRDLINGLPEDHVWAKYFPPVCIAPDVLYNLREKRIVKLNPENEAKLCKWTGMEPSELYLNRNNKEGQHDDLKSNRHANRSA